MTNCVVLWDNVDCTYLHVGFPCILCGIVWNYRKTIIFSIMLQMQHFLHRLVKNFNLSIAQKARKINISKGFYRIFPQNSFYIMQKIQVLQTARPPLYSDSYIFYTKNINSCPLISIRSHGK